MQTKIYLPHLHYCLITDVLRNERKDGRKDGQQVAYPYSMHKEQNEHYKHKGVCNIQKGYPHMCNVHVIIDGCEASPMPMTEILRVTLVRKSE